jgi:hypothetical protein
MLALMLAIVAGVTSHATASIRFEFGGGFVNSGEELTVPVTIFGDGEDVGIVGLTLLIDDFLATGGSLEYTAVQPNDFMTSEPGYIFLGNSENVSFGDPYWANIDPPSVSGGDATADLSNVVVDDTGYLAALVTVRGFNDTPDDQVFFIALDFVASVVATADFQPHFISQTLAFGIVVRGQPRAIPEPSAFVLAGLGFVGLVGYRRFQKRS